MRKELLGLLLVGGLAGCTSQWDTDRADTSGSSAASAETAPTPAKLVAERGSQRSFASLPDRGELLQYAKDRKVRKSGAYTYHPVAISEAHALNAIAKGGMRINMPDGKTLDLKYDRYEEQPDGNWTWIGRNEDGSEAVLTFGDKAVFGMVASGGHSYGVRTDRAGAWIIETNQALLAAGGGHGRRKEGPDYLAPATPAALSGAGPVGTAAAISQKQAPLIGKAGVDEKAAAVVDLLLGYSAGVVATVGSESGAQTLVANRVALTNAAYQTSGVNMRLRLVHSMLVNYSDTGFKNDATLRRLTGYDETTQQNVPVDSAFTALRAARDQYGADLVALVRQYREPEQDGCGIAWLIGMNQRAISPASDAGFGYAVVGDGTDLDESDSRTYKCSLYALAHELGHLMGQAHNTEDSAGRSGAHSYSYGYREAASTGFFTIMAYPRDDTQAANEVGNFANPAVSVSGRPTGVANASDNVRSMNQTMPIVSTFRATSVPLLGAARNDVDIDGRSDLLFHNPITHQFSYRIMNGLNVTRDYLVGGVGPGYKTVATGDFTGDGRVDLVWTNTANLDLYMWVGNGTTFTSTRVGTYPSGWTVVGALDIDGDGRSDLLFHNPTTRQFSYRIMNGTAVTRDYLVGGVGAGYTVAATGDFNGDGFGDIVWTNAANLDLYMWLGNGNTFTSTRVGTYPSGWSVAGALDVDGDGRSDLLFHNPTTRQFSYRIMNGTTVSRDYLVGGLGAGYVIATTGDFNGDGFGDVVWTNANNLDMYMWIGNGNTFTSSRSGTYPWGWGVIR